VYLSLGSNVGDRTENLRTAIAALPATGINVEKVSSFYETEPVDYLEQGWFVNCVVQAQTDFAPLKLLSALRGIEHQMGSKKLVPKGPRPIDIDILLYGDQIIETQELQVPHPRMHLRRFVLVPMKEIAPDACHPRLNLSVAELLAQSQDASQVRLLSEPADK
jgi:2-amino-4-hydroxy-6-hydroxymethyldihydropteridine diphosphokinase